MAQGFGLDRPVAFARRQLMKEVMILPAFFMVLDWNRSRRDGRLKPITFVAYLMIHCLPYCLPYSLKVEAASHTVKDEVRMDSTSSSAAAGRTSTAGPF